MKKNRAISENNSHIGSLHSRDESAMRELPPLNALRAFEALGQCGSLSGAAERLNVTHGAISKQIKLLEGHLSIQLITRSGRGVELTAEGRRLMDRLTHAFGQLDAAVQCLDESGHEG